MWTVLLTAILTGLIFGKEIFIGHGPVGTPCTSARISCDPSEVILLEARHRIKKYRTKSNNCKVDESGCPEYSDTDFELMPSLKERRHLHSQCSNRQVCNITIPYNGSGDNFNYMVIPYHCKSDKHNVNMLKVNNTMFPEAVSVFLPRNSHTPINRNYTIQSSLPLTIKAIYVTFGRDWCSKLIISSNNERLWNCSDELMIFNQLTELEASKIEIVMDNLLLHDDEYFWLQFTSDADISIYSTSVEENKKVVKESIANIKTYIVIIMSALLIVVVVAISVCLLIYFKKKNCKNQKQLTEVEYSLEKKVDKVEPTEMDAELPEPLYSQPMKRRPEVTTSQKPDVLYSDL